MNSLKLPEELRARIDYSLLRSTRIHPLPSNPQVWIKREDELSGSISGSKLRKYASLIPQLRLSKIQVAALIGGPNSNNLVGLAQLLRENEIKPLAFIRKAGDQTLRGNALLLEMLLHKDEVIRIPRLEWNRADSIAREQLAKSEKKSILIPEGAYVAEAIPGAMTLAESVLKNELQNAVSFPRIYIDCGTGLSAIAFILGMEILSSESAIQREIVITLIANTEKKVRDELDRFRTLIEKTVNLIIPNRCKLTFLKPQVAPKFGSVNATLFSCCKEIASEEGLLMDPTYSVKHFTRMKQDLLERPTPDESLFVFNGSALGLMGFQTQLKTTVS